MTRPSRTAALLARLHAKRADYSPGDFAVALDTREQKIGPIDPRLPVIVRTLDAGDLSVVGHETEIALDRKQLDDFVGCITSDGDRFERELTKLAKYDFAAIVVEATLSDVRRHRYRSATEPSVVVAHAARIAIEHKVPVFFAGPIDVATDFAVRLLRHWHRSRAERAQATATNELECALMATNDHTAMIAGAVIDPKGAR